MFTSHTTFVARAGLALIAVALLALAPAARADEVYSFVGLSNNDPTNTARGEAQLSMTVSQVVAGTVDFLFRNDGINRVIVTDIYFDDGANRVLDAITSVIAPSGVKFTSDDISPVDPDFLHRDELAIPRFTPTPGLAADSNSPILNHGIANNEWLTLRLSLSSGASYSSVLQELTSGELRAGVLAQGFGNRGKESFVNLANSASDSQSNPTTPAVAPTPAAFGGGLLLLIGMSLYIKLRGKGHLAA